LNLPKGTNYTDSQYRFALQGEDDNGDDTSEDDSQQTLDIVESYIHADLNEDGIAEFVKITSVGGESPSYILDIEELDSSPWIATTGILMSHKFKGLSIYDRLKEIQDQKTALWRSIFDNIYLQNNQRNIVVEGQVNLDDLMVSRPGGIVRAKRLDAVQPLVTPQLGQESHNMMAYLDEVRAGRVGVSAEGSATPQNIGDRVGSEGVDRLMNSKEELVGLIIRVIAETGIKPLCLKIRDLSRQHLDTTSDYKFRGDWVKVHPKTWIERDLCTVRVGTGTGDHTSKLNALREVMSIQEKALDIPGQAMVDPQNIYDTLETFCKLSGLNGAGKYFIDPSSQKGQQKTQQIGQQQQQQQQKQEEMVKALELRADSPKLFKAEMFPSHDPSSFSCSYACASSSSCNIFCTLRTQAF
jgi:hypothetical protein